MPLKYNVLDPEEETNSNKRGTREVGELTSRNLIGKWELYTREEIVTPASKMGPMLVVFASPRV
jgi:hypothetical protein